MPGDQPNQPQPPPASTPTPGDPRENTPVQDPPVHPEHDDSEVLAYQENDDESAQIESNTARSRAQDGGKGDEKRTVFDENKSAR